MNWKKTVLICLLLLLCGAGITAVIFFTEPTAQREGATRRTAMLVEVTPVERGTFHPTIVATGVVEADREILLSPLVAGELVERAPGFTPGGQVRKGELLLRIDPADYRNLLQQRQGDLEQALGDLAIEMGRQDVARQDYALFDQELPAEKMALVLRKPQLDIARARVETARAALRQAEIDLQRTRIRAPFNAHILSREVDVGSQVAPGDRLGRLVGLDTYRVETTIPLSKLEMISIPDTPDSTGAEVRITNRSAWPDGTWRRGRISGLVGALEQPTRMARLHVTISDPLSVRPESAGLPPLLIGSFVEVHIRADAIDDVMRLERDYVRDSDTVWIMEDGALRIRDVGIVFRDARFAYIDEGIEPGARVVTTNLSTVTEGVPLRLKGSERNGDGDRASGEATDR